MTSFVVVELATPFFWAIHSSVSYFHQLLGLWLCIKNTYTSLPHLLTRLLIVLSSLSYVLDSWIWKETLRHPFCYSRLYQLVNVPRHRFSLVIIFHRFSSLPWERRLVKVAFFTIEFLLVTCWLILLLTRQFEDRTLQNKRQKHVRMTSFTLLMQHNWFLMWCMRVLKTPEKNGRVHLNYWNHGFMSMT